MPNYWIFPITQDSLYVSLDKEIVGTRSKNRKRVENWEIGDLIIFYVSREEYHSMNPVREFQALVECISHPFESNQKIWSHIGGDVFPTRVRIRVVNKKKCKIMPLIERLSFIKNKKNWGSAFFSGIRKISQNDFNLIIKAMK